MSRLCSTDSHRDRQIHRPQNISNNRLHVMWPKNTTWYIEGGQEKNPTHHTDASIKLKQISLRCSLSFQYHQYTDDMQLHLVLHADTTATGLAVLAECSIHIRQWYLQAAERSTAQPEQARESSNQLRAVSSVVSSVAVTGVDLLTENKMRVLGVKLNQRLTFDKHVTMEAHACNHYTKAIHHIRHLLTFVLAHAGLSFPGSTTAIHCFTKLRSPPSTSCSEFRTMQLWLCCRCWNGLMWSHHLSTCIGCPLNSTSGTRWPCSLSSSRASQRRHISTTTSRYIYTLKTFGHRRLQCCLSHSPRQTTSNVPLAAQLQMSGTRNPGQLSKVTLLTFKSKLKTFHFSHFQTQLIYCDLKLRHIQRSAI